MKRNTQNNGQLPIIDWQFNRIAVKIGSNVLTRKDGTLDITGCPPWWIRWPNYIGKAWKSSLFPPVRSLLDAVR